MATYLPKNTMQTCHIRDATSMSRGWWPHEKANLKDLALTTWPDDETMRKVKN